MPDDRLTRVNLFWLSVNTLYPSFSRRSRTSVIMSVCLVRQLTQSVSSGALSQLSPSCWALNHAAHSHELSPTRSLLSQVVQTYGPVSRSRAIHRLPS